ncbi:MAG: amidophosphoribosyltransferase [Eubacteriales bacterium]|nr:amidophosphoribosyltransferase [Eubacteriales bacterium]
MEKLHEECGVFGIYTPEDSDVATSTYYGLFALQHRGQESCGIVVNEDGIFRSYKEVGIVNDVFTAERLNKLGTGKMALGHVRYGTSGTDGRLNAQPVVVNHIKGHMAIANNGCLVNSYELREELELQGSIFISGSDAEIISHVIIKERLNSQSVEEAISKAMNKLKGAYSIVVMSPSKLIAARDENGFHPLCYGILEDGGYVIASETCALDSVGADFVRDIEPGEIVVITKDGVKSVKDHCKQVEPHICIFEYIYFARPDSVIDGISVHQARVKAGECLAQEHPVEADVVIGVPDSGLDAAIGYSRESGIPYGIGFIKNKYIGRTFIAPGQKTREDKVRIKLNTVAETVRGKRVVLIDDSIVRGTTCARIVKLLRDSGATEVHLRSSAPPFVNPCYYGTDIGSRDVLIACNHTLEEITKIIGVDSLGYLSVDSIPKLIGKTEKCGYCDACFTNNYPTEIPGERVKRRYEQKISEKCKR